METGGNKKGDELVRRIINWVVDTMRFIDTLPKITSCFSVGKQLADSSGSVGANFVEARASRSHKEFTSSVGIAAKECKESLFWLVIMQRLKVGDAVKNGALLKEGNEIASILTTICKNAKLKNETPK